jgi:hypothetical protein
LAWTDLSRIKGESVTFVLPNDWSGEDLAGFAEKIATDYRAEIVWVEEIGGVTSYYCHTLNWSDGVTLYGRKINLHIAVSRGRCAVGSPIIFGGF